MELRPIELAILRHVALYRITLNKVVERLFGKQGVTTLSKLAAAGFLRAHKKNADGAFPGPVSYHSLMPAGARIVGASEDRAEKFQMAALRSHLATLWFCHMSDQRRYRLEPGELATLFGADAPHANVACCLANETKVARIYRVYETSTDVRKSIKQLRTSIAGLWESSTLRPWLLSGELGFAVLAETKAKCSHLNKAIQEARSAKPSVADECHIIVRFAPSPSTLKGGLE